MPSIIQVDSVLGWVLESSFFHPVFFWYTEIEKSGSKLGKNSLNPEENFLCGITLLEFSCGNYANETIENKIMEKWGKEIINVKKPNKQSNNHEKNLSTSSDWCSVAPTIHPTTS